MTEKDKQNIFANYIKILQSELIPAMGCTEPIAVAFAAAKAREVLGVMPEKIEAYCSGNIIKNVKSVEVPNAGGLRGVEAAAILGAFAGKPELVLEVISQVTTEQQKEVYELWEQNICTCKLQAGVENLYIRIRVYCGSETAEVTLERKHDHISGISKNGQIIFQQDESPQEVVGDKNELNIESILMFAREVPIEKIRDLLLSQAITNSQIAEEGMKNNWGANIGKSLQEFRGDDIATRMAAAAAAGSDARMSGCCLPVVINSGSGNQGITVTMPVVVYAREKGFSEEEMIRALAVSNLISIHQKRYIGNLSAYCGAVSAGTAAICGVAFLDGEGSEMIGNIIINTLGTIGGIVCDGAKASCAAKIASSVEAAQLSYEMAKKGRRFRYGDGLIDGGAEQTIRNIGRMGRDGMRSTDEEILHIMIGQ